MSLEDKWAVALGVFSVLLLIVGTVVSKVISTQPPKVIRTVWPIAAMLTGAAYATFVYIARHNVKG